MKGKFITFEGTEGSGKSTQSKLLYDYLRSIGRKVIYLREPGGIEVAEQIRKVLLDVRNRAMSFECETLLYMAARAQATAELIKPALAEGRIIICDRFLDSTVAYQGYGLGVSLDFIKRIGKFATLGIKPDLTIFLDLPLKEGLHHRRFSRDRIEQRPFAYHKRVRGGYLKLAKQEPERIKVVKLADSISVTQKKIRDIVCRLVA